MNVQDVMTRSVTTCLAQDCLYSVARLLWERDCGSLPIVDRDGRPIAMITDRDVCMAAYTTGKPLHELRVATAMSKRRDRRRRCRDDRCRLSYTTGNHTGRASSGSPW